MGTTGKKQRRVRLRRRMRIRYGTDKPEFTGYTGNVSRTGLMIRAVRVFAPGTRLRLEVDLGESVHHVEGRVRWAREGGVRFLSTGRIGMGIEFVDPPASLLEALRAGAAGQGPGDGAGGSHGGG